MSTFIIGALLAGGFAFAGHKVYKDKKNGNCCSGNCSKCGAMCKSSHK